jgi:hypothetical protein
VKIKRNPLTAFICAECRRCTKDTVQLLTIQDRVAMVDPDERAEIERQAIDAFAADLARSLARAEIQAMHGGMATPVEILQARRKFWIGVRA